MENSGLDSDVPPVLPKGITGEAWLRTITQYANTMRQKLPDVSHPLYSDKVPWPYPNTNTIFSPNILYHQNKIYTKYGQNFDIKITTTIYFSIFIHQNKIYTKYIQNFDIKITPTIYFSIFKPQIKNITCVC